MPEAIETIEYKGYKIKIYQDEDTENPIQEWDMLGEFICWHKRYNLGNTERFDKYEALEELEKYVKRTNSLLYPLYMYEHSGVALSLTGFSCPWDAGQLGYVLVDRKKALKEYNKKVLTKKLKQQIYERTKNEVKIYNQFLSGDIYGCIIKKDDEIIDNYCGSYGLDETIEAVKIEVDGYEIPAKEKIVV